MQFANKETIDEIVEIEWELFTNLNATGGREACQDNKEEFVINRESQWESLSLDVVNSYLRDLYRAEDSNRNLLFEKYAYMMEYTHKDEYDRLKPYLPKEDNLKNKVIEKIATIMDKWEKEFKEKYPKLSALTRPMEDNGDIASTNVYLIGEHKSYSYTTNLLYLEFIKSIDYNLVEEIYKKIVSKKGFSSIQELENNL